MTAGVGINEERCLYLSGEGESGRQFSQIVSDVSIQRDSYGQSRLSISFRALERLTNASHRF